MSRLRPRSRAWGASLLGLAALLGGCGSSETPPAEKTEQADRPSNDHNAPPLGKPRPKKLPGDVLQEEEEEES